MQGNTSESAGIGRFSAVPHVTADNRLAELAGWDKEILAIELQGLLDLNFEVELTGFDA